VFFFRETAAARFFGPLFAFDAVEALPPISTPDGVFLGDGLANVDFTVHDQTTSSYAAFGNADYTIFDLIRLHGGVRYTKDWKSFLESFRAAPIVTRSCSFLENKAEWSDTSFKGGLDILASEDMMIYGSYTQGFKAGGFNATGCGDQYDPETVDAFEGGLKTQLFENRARINVTGFDYSYDNIQTVRTTLVTQEVVNGPQAKMRGVELETAASPLEGLRFDGTFAWLYAEYTEFTDDDSLTPVEGPRNLAGNRLPKTPEIAFSLGVQYTLPVWSYGDLTARYDYAYTDGYYFTAFNERVERQRAYGMSNAFLLFEHGSGVSVKGFVKNIEEEYVRTGVIPTAPIGGYLVNFGPPRTWGFEVGYRF
ncbi:MAG: TonB-dependent receptor, partial [Candidatus Binatia bacterium]